MPQQFQDCSHVCPYDPTDVLFSSLRHTATEPVPYISKYEPKNLNIHTHTNIFICNVIMNVIRGYQDQQDAINYLC